jgi:hypothetical protein
MSLSPSLSLSLSPSEIFDRERGRERQALTDRARKCSFGRLVYTADTFLMLLNHPSKRVREIIPRPPLLPPLRRWDDIHDM